MKVLVTAASRHGSTEEIARAIATELEAAQISVDVLAPEAVTTLEGYDAVVLGSGVYAGHWLEPAKEFAERYEMDLREVPVFLFSSGPLGDPPKPVEEPVDAALMDESTHAVDHRVFAGRLIEDDLNLPQRVVIKVVGAPYGDFRPWDDIAEWAAEIARFLKEEEATPVGQSVG